MIVPVPRSSHGLAWVLVGVATTGLALSMLLTQDSQWVEWHLSRLGEGNSSAAFIFNGTMILSALVLMGLASRITDEIRHRGHLYGAHWLYGLLVGAAVGLVGVGLFPFDRFPIIHNLFGYGQFFILCAATITLRFIYPQFQKRTYAIGYAAVCISLGLMVLFHLTHFTTLLVVELTGQLFVYAWLLSMTRDMTK